LKHIRVLVLACAAAVIGGPAVASADDRCLNPDVGIACIATDTSDPCTVKGLATTGYNYGHACAVVTSSMVSISVDGLVILPVTYLLPVTASSTDGRSSNSKTCLNEQAVYFLAGAGGCIDLTLRHDPGRADVGAQGVATAYYGVLTNCQRARVTFDSEGFTLPTPTLPRVWPSVEC